LAAVAPFYLESPPSDARLTRSQIVSRLDTKAAPPYGFAQEKWKPQAPACSQRLPLWRYLMPLSLMTLSFVDSPITLKEGLKILERDDYCCQYCGLDGRASFENALVMRVDFVVPRARKGKKEPSNLVACCTACNTVKGTRLYVNFEEAKAFVLKKREELQKNWESKIARRLAKAARA
jgi:HNH endonuclease